MFARIFGKSATLRRSLGLGAFLLALSGGVLAIWAAVGSSASTFVRVLHAITGLGAIIPGRRIYHRSQALLFPRTRMNAARSEEHTSELQSHVNLVCRLVLEKKKRPATLRRCRTRPPRPRSTTRVPGPDLPGVPPPAPARRGFFFDDPATTEIYTPSLHHALPN